MGEALGGLLPEVELKLQVRVQEAHPAPLICTVGLVASHQLTESARRADEEAADVTLNFNEGGDLMGNQPGLVPEKTTIVAARVALSNVTPPRVSAHRKPA